MSRSVVHPKEGIKVDRLFTLGHGSPQDLRNKRGILSGDFAFRAHLPISKASFFGDDTWDWYDPDNLRLEGYCRAYLRIDWRQIGEKYGLNETIVGDFKKYAFIRYAYSREVYGTIKNAHPASLVREVSRLANFIGHVIKDLSGEGSFIIIENLGDIRMEDLQTASKSYGLKLTEGLMTALKCLASPMFGEYIKGGPLGWTPGDVGTLDWLSSPRKHTERLPDGMFRLLSNSATKDVKQFLRALDRATEDTTVLGDGQNAFLELLPNFRQLFEEYARRIASKTVKSDRANSRSDRYRRWRLSLGPTMSLLDKTIGRAQKAAQTIIAFYTGARLGEFTSFRVGCLAREGDEWVLRGTLKKQTDLHAPVLKDKWVTIPIIRDAIKALEEICRLTNDRLLFPASDLHGRKCPMNSTQVRRRLTEYLHLADVDARWPQLSIHARQFRETLVYELRKGGLGIPFITYQLKHAYYAFGRINNTTLGYGCIASSAAQKAVEDANLEAIRDIYHPDAMIAGGGAAHFKARVTEYFRGRVEHGENVDDILRDMARRGDIPMIDVGPGLCMGQLKVVVDGVKEDPLCIGGLRCNPSRCGNGLIPRHKAHLWEAMGKANRARANDPEFAHAKVELEEAADECDVVTAFLKRTNNQKTVNANL